MRTNVVALGFLCAVVAGSAAARPVTVAGRVVYGSDEPAVGMQVVVGVAAGDERRREFLRTDEEGRFEVSDFEPGAVNIRAGGPGDVPVETNLEVRAGRVATNIILRLPSGGFAGHVRDAAGQPVPGAAILLFDGRGDSLRLLRADDEGAFRFRGLADGVYTLACMPASGRPAVPRRRIAIEGSRMVEGLLLEPGQLTACGRVIDHEGDAVTQAIVFVRALDEELRASGVRGQAVTGADGGFCVSNLYPSAYEVIVDARERGRLRRDRVLLQTSRDDLAIVLGGGAELAGRVLDGAGQAVSGAYVQAVAPMESEVASARALTDADGRFRLPRLRPAEYRVFARGAAGLSPWVTVEAVPSMKPREFELVCAVSASSVTGILVEAGRPVSNAFVMLEHQWGLDLPTMATTDGRGRYAFTGLPGGSYRLRIANEGRWIVRDIPLGDRDTRDASIDVRAVAAE